jgi:hypothetical protein
MNTYTAFAVATAERAVKTFCQSLVALLLADGTDLLDTAWVDRLSVAGMAAVISVLTSVASAPVGGSGPSLVSEATVPPARDDAGAVPWVTVAAVAVVLVCVVWLIANVDVKV